MCRIETFGFPGCKNYLNYYTSTSWLAGEREFIFFVYGEDEFGLYACEAETQKIRKISAMEHWKEQTADDFEGDTINALLLPKQNVLLLPKSNELWKVNLEDGTETKLCEFDSGRKYRGPLTSSPDENVICGGIYPESFSATHISKSITTVPITVCDSRSGEILFSTEIPYNANHFQFFPCGEKILFAHEGDTRKTPDRLNILNWKTGEWGCVYKQQVSEDGEVLECVGHEMIAADKIVAVRYPASQTEEFGLLKVNPVTGEGKLIDADDYWHCASDAKGERFVMDTMWWDRSSRKAPNRSDIVYFDSRSGEKKVICTVISGIYSQAYHPHPRFSPSGDKILFAMQKEDNTKELFIGMYRP